MVRVKQTADKPIEGERKIKLRAKYKTGSQRKTSKDNSKLKIARHRNRNSVTVEDPSIQHLLLGRPRKIKDANELITEFNAYLASCIEKTRKIEQTPIETEQVEVDKEIEKIKSTLDGKNVTVKNDKGGKIKVTNNVITKFEIIEGEERKTTPSIGGFLIFLGGLSYKTWDTRRDSEDLGNTVENINNTLESILIDQAARGKYNPQIAQFVLNVRYNRIPKKEVDNNIKGSVFKESDFIKD